MIAQPVACPNCSYWKERALKAEQREKQRRQFWKTKFKPAEKATVEEIQRQMDSPQAVKDADGFTRICYETAAINIGMSSKTVKSKIDAVLEQAPSLPLETKVVDEPLPGGKGTIPRLYAKTNANLLQVAARVEIEHKREQGGNQYKCNKCGSDNVKVTRRLVCLDCNHEIDLEPTYPNGKIHKHTSKSGRTNLSLVPTEQPHEEETSKSGRTNLSLVPNDAPTEKILTPDGQLVEVMVITSEPPYADNLPPEDETTTPDLAINDITRAAALLLAIAGQDEKHIEMSRTGAGKYYTVHESLKLSDCTDHLHGGQARGASCSYPDGQTRSLAWDTENDPEEWEAIEQAARQLAEAGYLPVLEPSPARPGGHLWIIFDALVDVAVVREHVYSIAPGLKSVPEYWPGPANTKWNRVRLPGGFYARYGQHVEHPVKAWCRLFNVATGESGTDGQSNARLLLDSLTPVSVVPVITVVESNIVSQEAEDATGSCNVAQQDLQILESVEQVSLEGDQAVRLPVVDEEWLRRHGPLEKTTLWFAISSSYAAVWFNERNSLEDILPRERNGMALSPNGNERTASTGYRGERWTDHSSHGRRPDGTRDTGDALELAVKVWGKPKGVLLAGITRQIVAQARMELEAAARSAQPLPAWLDEIITPAGRRKYAELLPQVAMSLDDERKVSITIIDHDAGLPEGALVITPAGLATIISIKKREETGQVICSVRTKAEQPNGSHYAVFALAEVHLVEQSKLL